MKLASGYLLDVNRSRMEMGVLCSEHNLRVMYVKSAVASIDEPSRHVMTKNPVVPKQ